MMQDKTKADDLVLMVAGDNFMPVNTKTNTWAVMGWNLDRAPSDHYESLNRHGFHQQVLQGIRVQGAIWGCLNSSCQSKECSSPCKLGET